MRFFFSFNLKKGKIFDLATVYGEGRMSKVVCTV